MDNNIMTDVLKCTEVLEPFSQGMGVYLSPEEVEYIKGVIRKQQQYIESLEESLHDLIKDQRENITGVGQL